jgi:hypothetical protein
MHSELERRQLVVKDTIRSITFIHVTGVTPTRESTNGQFRLACDAGHDQSKVTVHPRLQITKCTCLLAHASHA